MAVAVVFFFGRIGLQDFAAHGLSVCRVIALGAVMIAVGLAPLQLPSGFLLHVLWWCWGCWLCDRARHLAVGECRDGFGPAIAISGSISRQLGIKWFGALLLIIALLLPFSSWADQQAPWDLAVLDV